MNLLELLLSVNVVSILTLLVIREIRLLKIISLIGAFLQLFVSSLLLINFEKNAIYPQFDVFYGINSNFNLVYHLAVDGLSLFFILLSVFLLPICLLCSWTTVKWRVKEFHIWFHIITLMLINVFAVQDILFFYIFFESVLIPMFLIIGIWGSRDRKIHAAYQFFLYTLAGSVLMLLAILYCLSIIGSTHIDNLYLENFDLLEGRLIWLAFFLSFAVKVPMMPFHIWLPEAHVEAPTAGSVLLAGILLKMGTYGLLRFSLPMFPEASIYFQPLVFVMSLVGIIYASCTTIRQIDLKKIIAYSSVGHMNYVTIGIMSNNLYGVEGSIFMMLGHGFVSSALFLCVGLLYERYHTRIISYYGGLIFGMPIFGILFLFFTLGNVSLPGTSNFIGEFLILAGCFEVHFISCFIATVGIILGAVYAIWLYNRVMFGSVKNNFIMEYSDLNKKELLLFFILVFFVLLLGIYPSFITDYLHPISIYVLLD